MSRHASTTCAIAGCGPAGIVLAFLLARAGIEVVVLEKHEDFLRDFRGDTIHPSTLELLDQLGLADELLTLPHTKVSAVELQTTAGQSVKLSLERLPSKFRFIAFMPQWDFLEFMARQAARFRTFTLLRHAEVTGLVESDDRIAGLRFRDADGEHELRATLTVAADGRGSRTRDAAKLPIRRTSPPIDVLWFRLPRLAGERAAIAGRIGPGLLLVMVNRQDYWQIAFVIPKDKVEAIRARGLVTFREDIARVAPELAGRVDQLVSWDDVKLLTVRVDRLTRWYKPGFLAIGDAAHAMSPIGGVGINLAIHDAVAAANVLWRPLADTRVVDSDLAEVQRRRERAVRIIQAFQGFVQTRLLAPTLSSTTVPSIPWIVRLALRTPIVRDIPPRMLALGIDRPHIESPSIRDEQHA